MQTKKRSPKKGKKRVQINEALNKTFQGGKIDRPKKKSQKKLPKIEEALEKKFQGGKLRYHSAIHKHLHKNLSGLGGRFDPPFVRQKMAELLSSYHPSVFHSYMAGKVKDIPQHQAYHPGAPVQPQRRERRPTIVNSGGSLRSLTHSENGLLQSFDSNFYSHSEIV